MDNGLEIFVYLIVIVVSIIGAVVKNSAKRKEEEQRKAQRAAASRNTTTYEGTTTEKKKPASMLEEFIRQQLGDFEEPEFRRPQEVEVDKPVVNNKEERYVEEGNAVFDTTEAALLSDDMQEDDFSISDSINESEQLGEIYNFNYNKIAENEISDVQKKEEFFDARKALIYSEIFKRPES